MKAIKKFITAVLLIFSFSLCNAQMAPFSPLDASNTLKSYSKNANSYIFEGYVIQTKKKKVATNMGNELICSIVQITKIYKGAPQLKLGTIKVLWYDYDETISVSDISFPSLSVGNHIIIFGKVSNVKAFDSITTDNSFILEYSDFIHLFVKEYYDLHTHAYVMPLQYDSLTKLHHKVITFKNPAADATWRGIKFPTIDSLNSFFKNNGLEVEEQVVQPADSTK